MKSGNKELMLMIYMKWAFGSNLSAKDKKKIIYSQK